MEEQHSMEDKNQHCLNCDEPLNDAAEFCSNCGQKNTDGRLTVKELFSQVFANVFNLDSKIFQILAALFVPGKLTIAFLRGQRRKYYHPIRLFLVLMILALAALKFQGNISSPGNLKKEHIDKFKERNRVMNHFDKEIKAIRNETEQAEVQASLDSLVKAFYAHPKKRIDSINVNSILQLTNDADFYVALDDLGEYSAEEIIDRYEVKGFIKRLVVKQKIKMVEDDGFISFILGKLTWVIFFVMALLALIFKLFFLKKDILYLEHLVFVIHLHSFFLIVVSMLLFSPEGLQDTLLPWTLLLMVLYLFVAMKRVYRQSYFVTSLKVVPLVMIYFFLFIFGIVFTMLGSFLIF